MRGRLFGAFLTGGAFLASQAGCTNLNLFHPTRQPVEPAGGVEVPVKNDQTALPPKEKAQALRTMAQGCEKSGRIEDAITYYEATRKIDPSQKGVCRRLGVLYDLLEKYPQADAEYQIALTLKPNDSDLQNDVGVSYQSRGNHAEAEKYFQKSVSLNPDNKKAWTNLGMTLAKLDKREESLAAFAKAVPLAQAHCNLGMILSQQNKLTEAKAEFRQALSLAPELRIAMDALRTLEEDPAKQAQRAKMASAAAAEAAIEEKPSVRQAEGGGFAESRDLSPTTQGPTAIDDNGPVLGLHR